MRYLFFSIMMLFTFGSYCREVDSLLHVLEKADNKTKLSIYEELCIAYYSIDLDSAGFFAEKMQELAGLHGNIEQKVISIKLVGNVYNIRGEFNLALDQYKRALAISKKNRLSVHTGTIINNIGTVYEYLGNYRKSLEYYLEALKIDSANANLTGIGNALPNIGNIYLRIGNYTDAISYYNKGLEVAKELSDNAGIVLAYNSLGMVYERISDYENSSKYYLRALKESEELEDYYSMSFILINLGTLYEKWDYPEKALEYYYHSKLICEKTNNLPNLIHVMGKIGFVFNAANQPDSAIKIINEAIDKSKTTNSPNVISALYSSLGRSYELKESYTQAKKYYEQSLSVRKKSDNTEDIASSLNELGRISYLMNDYVPAIGYIKKSIHIATWPETKIDNYKLLSEIYVKIDIPDKALYYFRLYSTAKDSIFTKEKHLQVKELQTKYETEKKEKEIALLSEKGVQQELELEKQNKMIIGLLGIVLLVIMITVFIFRQNKLKQKQKALELEQKLLRLQMNPHFIFNAISAIQHYIVKNKPLEASSYLSSFAKLMRSILNNSKLEMVTLEEEKETLKDYLNLQKLRLDGNLEYKIDGISDNNSEELVMPPMLLQPFIENAIEHGILKKKGQKGKIEIKFSEKNNKLFIEITDNGIGRERSETLRNKEHNSFATEITKSRIKSMKQSYKKGIFFDILDLKNSNNDPIGTKVIFELPLIYS